MNPEVLENLDDSKLSPVSLALDEYDDLFSDFDSRPFSERLLSDDFLHELRRASLDRQESGLSLLLLLGKERRSPAREKVIKERMKAHFRSQRLRLEAVLGRRRRLGYSMLAVGVLLIFLTAALLYYGPKNFLASFVVVLLEPAGWFTFWEGLHLIVFGSREISQDLKFHRKMAKAKIQFSTAAPVAEAPVSPGAPKLNP